MTVHREGMLHSETAVNKPGCAHASRGPPQVDHKMCLLGYSNIAIIIFFWLVQRLLYSVHSTKVRCQEMKYNTTRRKVINCPILAAIVVAIVLIEDN